MTRRHLALLTLAVAACTPARSDPYAVTEPAHAGARTGCADDLRAGTAAVRAALERQYGRNRSAFLAENLDSVMALRSQGFSTVGPDGRRSDRAQMAEYTLGLFNGITRWIGLSFAIERLTLEGNLARAQVSQHLERMALRADQQVHHVETWARQRETWICEGGEWKLHYVDQVRDQRRMVDSVPG
ncbi:MAG TPA: nuclear transport factor 2 family protein [Gemmatimonadales bacterium]